jgi:hypothetical protein
MAVLKGSPPLALVIAFCTFEQVAVLETWAIRSDFEVHFKI